MQDMVKRIVEMDKHARELTDEAKRLKVGAESRIIEKKKELRQGYMEKVNERAYTDYHLVNYYGAPDADKIIVAMGLFVKPQSRPVTI